MKCWWKIVPELKPCSPSYPKYCRNGSHFASSLTAGSAAFRPDWAPNTGPAKRLLVDQLPRLLAGYGKKFAADPPDDRRSVLVICDLDDRDLAEFMKEIRTAVERFDPLPRWNLCLAIEEGEAWLLGVSDAVMRAYPRVKHTQLKRYIPDSICGTRELMADLLYKGGARVLKTKHYAEIGAEKCRWAKTIAPHVDPARHRSPSFRYFAETLLSRVPAGG